MTMDGQSYTFTPDGKEVKTPWGTTMSIKAADAKTWEMTERTDGKVSMSGALKVVRRWQDAGDERQADEAGRRDVGRVDDPDARVRRSRTGGQVEDEEHELELAGDAGADAEGGERLRIALGGDGGVCEATLDGKEHPAQGKMWPAGWTCAVTKAGNGLGVRWRRDGKDMYKITWTPSSDAQTLTERGSAAGISETFTIVYDRQ